jgi:hypothetical protein
MMASADPSFPLYLWDEIMVQAEITVNILHPYADNHHMSAYEGIMGKKYDFMAHPFAPIGTAVLIYETPDQRESFANHGVKGFYIGPVLNSYRSFRVYVTHLRSFRETNTLAWFPKPFKMPGSDKTEQLLVAIKELELSVTTAEDGGASIKPIIQMLRDSISLYDGQKSTKDKSIMVIQQPQISLKLDDDEIKMDATSNSGREKGVVDEQPTYIDPTIQDAVAGRTRSRSRHLVNATAVNPITGKP